VRLLTPVEAAKLLSVRRETIYRWIKSGDLKAYTLSRHMVRISESDLKQFLKKNRTHV
jgi:excisionase family DNA binding protein